MGRSCVVALSGGPDSAALAWLANRFAASARTVHVDHGQAASPDLAAAAQRVAGQLAMRFAVLNVDVPSGPSFEQQARIVRYEALLAALEPDEYLLTGHTAHDNAETFLLNVVRGAGTTGMAGIPMERGRVMRPMLEVSRDVVRALVTDERLEAVDDPTNTDPAHARNRIRHEILPRLGSPVAIARAARLAAADDEVLELEASRVPIRVGAHRASIPLAALRTLPEPLASRVIRRGMRIVNPPYPGTSQMIEAVRSVVAGSRPRVELGEGVVAYRSQASLVLECGQQPVPAPVVLVGPQVDFGFWQLSVYEQPAPLPAYPFGSGVAAFADPPELLVRVPRPGDRMPLKGGGHKDVADVFAEAGISRDQRRIWPVVVDADLVWWVPGVRRGWLGWGDSHSGRYLVANILREG